MTFDFTYLNEPKLQFQSGEAYNPPVGLWKYGPRFSSSHEKGQKWLKIGIIGSGASVSRALLMLEDMKIPAKPENISKWNLPFPGIGPDSQMKFSFLCEPEWQEKLTSTEIKTILSSGSGIKIAEKFTELIDAKLAILHEKTPQPDCVIISLPKEIEDACIPFGVENPLLKLPNEDDLHSRIKIYGIKYGLPTQVLRSKTLNFVGTQEKNIVFWNFAVGLLYKSQNGYPWKLANLEDNTCYVGISFFKEKGTHSNNIRASMAQVFLDTGESFILRGDSFEWNDEKHPFSPHLSSDSAKKLVNYVITQYKQIRHDAMPSRIVIHKTSSYWEEEKDGFMSAIEKIPKKDLITISETGIRFYRPGKFSVLRGTLISNSDFSRNLLYTTGFAPSLNTYPGLGIPRPLLIKPDVLDSNISDVCSEILAFTKLDWNNTFMYRKHPVTLSVSQKVGNVLSDSIAKVQERLDPHYYFYM